MALIKCEECGQMFESNLTSCPNCGCPNEHPSEQTTPTNTSASVYTSTEREVDYNDLESISEPAWLAWFKPWHFSGNDSKEQASYNVLNDVSLFANMVLKIMLYVTVYMLIILIPYHIISFFLIQALAKTGMLFILIQGLVGLMYVFGIVYLGIKAIGKAVKIYWIPLLNVHRRIHARYWKAMYKEIKKQ